MTSQERLYPEIGRLLYSREASIGLSQERNNLYFAMLANGYAMAKNGNWEKDPSILILFKKELNGEQIQLFGPNSEEDTDEFFVGTNTIGHADLMHVLAQPEVIEVIEKYRDIDENQAARIAFIFGGIARYLLSNDPFYEEYPDVMADKVRFAADITKLGQGQSGDAIACAAAKYILSGGRHDKDIHFQGHTFNMSEAISEDPIIPSQTEDLGLSQVARLQSFLNKIKKLKGKDFPDIEEQKIALDEFPTVGAEFHIPINDLQRHPDFMKRLAILNMSQYQRGSCVQFSGNDRGVLEVRMNPSVYPITIANWEHIRLFLPELNHAYFTLTINRGDGNFFWENNDDRFLLTKLRALGMLTYAGVFENIPMTETRAEVNFGNIYLGQTAKLRDGTHTISGNWGKGEGHFGQLAIYTGFGENFQPLAYYLSMALANPDIIDPLPMVNSKAIYNLADALAISSLKVRNYFDAIQNRVKADPRLRKAFEAGDLIMNLLKPAKEMYQLNPPFLY